MNNESSQTSSWFNRLGPLIGLMLVFTLFSILKPGTFLTAGNIEIMLLQTAVVGTAALGMTLIIIAGGIDLSVGANIALCTVVVALLLNAGLPPLLALAGGVLTGAACGTCIGFVVTRFSITPFIVTLGMWGALRGAAKGLANEQMVIVDESTWLVDLMAILGDQQRWMLLPSGVWIMIVLGLLTAGLLKFTRLGRHIYAIGSNEQTARLCGVHVERTKLILYSLGAGLAGVAGVLQYSYLTMGDPTTSMGAELDVIAAVVIGGGSLSGGEGSVLGSLIGALIMTVIGNGCTKLGLANWIQEIVTGCIIIAAVAVDRWRQRRKT